MRQNQRGDASISSALTILLFGALLAVGIVAGVRALAQTSGGGYLDGGALGGQISDFLGGLVGGPGSSSTGSSGAGSGGGGGPVPDCTAPAYEGDFQTSAPATGPPRYVAVDPGRSSLVDSLNAGYGSSETGSTRPSPDAKGSWYQKYCGAGFAGYVWVPEGADPAAAAPPPPPPPTPAEVRDRTPLPDPTFGVSPSTEGLTGLETWLWDANGPGSRTVNMTIRGYTVVATATPGRWEWDMGGGGRNPDPVLVANHPGSEADPAARYTYETDGDYTLTLRTTWSGSFTFSGNGVPPQTQTLGTSVQESSLDYHVIQVVAALMANQST